MPYTEPCQENLKIPRGYDTSVIKLYFWVGLVSAGLLRIIIIADHYNPIYAKVIWYLGVLGYLWFFAHRYHIAERRFGVIKDLGLLKKIQKRENMSEKDYEGLEYLLWSHSVSKERTNYLVISVLSVVSIVASLIFDLGVLKP